MVELFWLSKSHHWLNENQHGFTSGKSTESAVHSLIAFCEYGKRSRGVSACAFLDIKSAFDAAWHPSILCSLVKLKCPHYLICLIASFLANHSAILSVDGEELLITINLGCPQGGVLSPFLWLILINDVLESVFPFPALILGYADDLTLATWHKDPAMATLHLQLMCNSVIAWCSTRKLSLNEAKTIFMLIGHKGDSALLNICINGVRIPPSLEVQLLGFTIDHRLSWIPHLKRRLEAAKRAFHSLKSKPLGALTKKDFVTSTTHQLNRFCCMAAQSGPLVFLAKKVSDCSDPFSDYSLHSSPRPLKQLRPSLCWCCQTPSLSSFGFWK